MEQGGKVVLTLQLQELSFILTINPFIATLMKDVTYAFHLFGLPMLTAFFKLDLADLPESTSPEF